MPIQIPQVWGGAQQSAIPVSSLVMPRPPTGHAVLKMISDALPQLLGPWLSRMAESWWLMYSPWSILYRVC